MKVKDFLKVLDGNAGIISSRSGGSEDEDVILISSYSDSSNVDLGELFAILDEDIYSIYTEEDNSRIWVKLDKDYD